MKREREREGIDRIGLFFLKRVRLECVNVVL